MSDDEELQKEEYKDLVENVQLKAIIAGSRAKRVSVKQGDVEIFIRSALPKPLRDRIISISKKYELGETETADEEIYEVMAQICLDEPYTKPAAWKYIDEETGVVPDVLKQMIEKITGTEGAAKRFR